MTDPIPWLIVLPLLWAAAAFVIGPGRGGWLGMAGIGVQWALALVLAVDVSGGTVTRHLAGGWAPPLGIELIVDGLSAVMLLLVQTVALALAAYAFPYFRDHHGAGRHVWPLMGLLLAAMNTLFLSGDLFNLYVALELLGLSAVCLVALGGGAAALSAALRYLLASLVGSGCYLMGVALLYATYGTVSLSTMQPLLDDTAPLAVVLASVLMLAGLMLKTALFPLHFWLPPAHGGAAPPVSALLSALVIKASFYLVLRLWLGLFEPIAAAWAAQLLGLLAMVAIVFGSIMALRQSHLKMLIAYSTVAQVGYLFLFFPLATQTSAAASQSALQGITLQIIAHGLAKAAMFAAAGAVIASTGHDKIALLGGISVRLPLTLFTFAVSGVTLMGLPPSVGFLAKWLLVDSAIRSGQWGWIVVLVVGGLLTGAYVFKVLRHAFLRTEQGNAFQPLRRFAEWPAFILALCSLLLGLWGSNVLKLVAAV